MKGVANTSLARGPGAQGDQDFKWAVEGACKVGCGHFRQRGFCG